LFTVQFHRLYSPMGVVMKQRFGLIWVVIFTGLFLLTAVATSFAVPGTINYQGVLTDGVGVPQEGTADVTFRLFDVNSGGSALWSETQNVSFIGGTYSVQLGAAATLAGLDFAVPYWLEIEVGGELLSPRQALTSAPYAMRAGSVEKINESALPASGLNEISNGLLNNQFIETAASATVPVTILDNNPIGIEDSIVFPDIGPAESISVHVTLTNSDLSTVTVFLTDPSANSYTLFNGANGGAGATGLNTSFPDPTAPESGDLTTWVGQNPAGTWTLKVVDSGFLNNASDGSIIAWSVSTSHVSTQKVEVAADMDVTGTVSGNGSGLTNVNWGSLINMPAGFADGVDNDTHVTSIDGLTGGQVTGAIGVGTNPNSPLDIRGSSGDQVVGFFRSGYFGTYDSYTLAVENNASGTGDRHGIYGSAGGSTYLNQGVSGAGSNGVNAIGVKGTGGGGSTMSAGVFGVVDGTGGSSPTHYGVAGYAINGTAHNYAVYGEASGTDSYAGYFEGNVAVTGKLTKEYSGTPAAAGPLAYAFIDSTGSVVTGTANVSSLFNSTSNRYEVTIAGESYLYYSYITVVTPNCLGVARTTSISGKLLVYIHNISGAATACSFQFVTYKP
jgi:subtilisin-like proprotein convertase family protein